MYKNFTTKICMPSGYIQKFLLMMKITFFLLFATLMQVNAAGFAQKITFTQKDATLKQVFKEINKQTGYNVFWSPKLIKNSRRLDVDFKEITLKNALSVCLKGLSLTYRIVEKTIIIKEDEKLFPGRLVNDIDVRGSVVDQKGQPLLGVTIKLKGAVGGVVTNVDGKYAIKLPNGNGILVFSYIGFITQEVAVNDQTTINIVLEEAKQALNEIVVVGYGMQSKVNLATSSSGVSSKELKNAVITTLDQALQGRVSGVQITQSSGEPGAAPVIRIRGNNSLSGDNQPLYVVDGFPLSTYKEASGTAPGSSAQNGLFGINPNDIESMEVLKDAAATAIYGSRGANGVILIKTKSGKAGEGKLEFINKTTFGNIINPYKMASSKEFAQLINEGFVVLNKPAPFTEANIAGLTNNTDWFKAITRTSLTQDMSLNVSGGAAKTNYYVSGNYLSDKGSVVGSKNNRASVRANVNSEVNNWYSIKAQLSLVRQNTSRAISDSRAFPANDGPILDALRASPIVAVDYAGFNGPGIPGFVEGNYFANPYTTLLDKTDKLYSDYIVANFENNFKLAPGLQFVLSAGSNQSLSRRIQYFPVTTAQGYTQKGTGSNFTANTYSYNVNAYLNYVKTFNQVHDINLTGGVEYNTENLRLLNTSSSGFDIPGFGIDNIGSARIQSVGSYKEDRTIQSGFFRANYTFNRKYVFNGSVRVDGASPFAKNKKYGVFPAVAAAWNLNEEEFMKGLGWLTNAKIRGSFGETGSQAINPYSSLAQYGNAFYQTGTGNGSVNTVLFPNTLPNSNLSWERTKQFDLGIDFSVIKNIINISFDYYNKTTEGLLQPRQLPGQSGFVSVTDNYGSIRNRGVELTVGANIINNTGFNWTSKLTVSHNNNILLNLGEITAPQYVSLAGNLQGGVSGILQAGKGLGLFYGERIIGLVQSGDIVGGVPKYPYPGAASDQIAGQWKFDDINKDGKIDVTNDRTVLGKATPDFTFGWNNDISYKNFGMNLFFTGSYGNDVLNLTGFYLNNGSPNFSEIFFNQTEDWYKNRWTPANPTNDQRYPGIQKRIPFTDINSAMVENGSFLRLKSATVYYNIPSNKIIKNARIFVTGTNLFTITKYTGFDPEVSAYGQSLLQQGIDYGSYPSNKTFTIGFSTNF